MVALIVVFLDLWAIAWIQNRYMETAFVRATFRVMLGADLWSPQASSSAEAEPFAADPMQKATKSNRSSIGAPSFRRSLPRALVPVLALVLLGPPAVPILSHGVALAEPESIGRVRSRVGDGIVNVEADGASIPDIIENLARTLGFEVHGDAPNRDISIVRKLEGKLDDLLAHLLHGGNYLIVTEAGAPKRLIILQAGPAVVQPFASMPIKQLRRKANELVVQIAQFDDMSQEARERHNPELASKFERHITELSEEMEAIRARLPP
jgi:hypothetical protein